MKAKEAVRPNCNLTTPDGTARHTVPDSAATFTPRQRLHQNIQRLQYLERQLFGDQQKQSELLTSIDLVGFKIRHLARQIQEAEPLSSSNSPS